MAKSVVRRPLCLLLASAAALAALPAEARDRPYLRTIFFGDSLTDAGFFRPLLPATVRPVTGQFTTNPGDVYSQLIAQFYGTDASANGNGQTGDNYAAGGARVGIDTVGALGPIPSLQTQVNTYLSANGGSANPDYLYTVYGGANDLFAITNAGANPTTTIAAAVGSQVSIVGQLTTAGARYILVPNIPDLGVTPAFRAQGAAAQTLATGLSNSYNAALYSGLNTAGLRYIPINTALLLNEVIANLGAFGFTNFTGTACQPQITANSLTCNPTSLVAPNAPQTYVFADGVHPTTATHAIFADYAISVLEAPRQIAVMPVVTALEGRWRADRVGIQQDRAIGDGIGLWADLAYGGQNMPDAGDGFDNSARSLLAGIDYTSGAFRAGLFAGTGRNRIDFDTFGGGVDQDETMVGAYAGMQLSRFWARAMISHSKLDNDIERRVELGPVTRIHTGAADGSNLSVGAMAGVYIGNGAVRHGPVLGLLSQRIKIDGYAEDTPTSSTSLAYDDQSFKSLVGSVGYKVDILPFGPINPFAQVTYEREFGDRPEEVYASVQSMPGTTPYAVPGIRAADNVVNGQLGARARFGGFSAFLAGGATLTDTDDGPNWRLNGGIGFKF